MKHRSCIWFCAERTGQSQPPPLKWPLQLPRLETARGNFCFAAKCERGVINSEMRVSWHTATSIKTRRARTQNKLLLICREITAAAARNECKSQIWPQAQSKCSASSNCFLNGGTSRVVSEYLFINCHFFHCGRRLNRSSLLNGVCNGSRRCVVCFCVLSKLLVLCSRLNRSCFTMWEFFDALMMLECMHWGSHYKEIERWLWELDRMSFRVSRVVSSFGQFSIFFPQLQLFVINKSSCSW